MGESAKRTILLVEDEAIIAMHEKRVLEKLGYSVRLAHSAEQALAQFASGPRIDLVLMDINLGRGMDGTEVARRLLDSRDVPIIFLSSHTEQDVVERTESISSYGYIVKNSGDTVLNASIKMAFKLFEAKSGLVETNRKLEATLDALPDIFVELDANGVIHDFHCPDDFLTFPAGSRVVGMHVEDVLPPEVSDTVLAAIDEAAEHGISRGRGYRMSTQTVARSFKISVSPVESPEHNRRFILISRDVTAQDRIEEELQASKLYAESLLNVAAEMVMVTDLEGSITLLNDSGHRLLGYEPGELIGKNWIETSLPAELKGEIRSFLEDLLNSHDDILVPHQNYALCKNGQKKLIYWRNTVLRDPRGRVIGILSSGEDVSETRRLETLYRTMIDASPDNISLTDLQGRLLMYSPKARTMFGFKEDENRIGSPVTDFLVPEDRQRAVDSMMRMLRGESRGAEEYRGQRVDGSLIDLEINGEIIRDAYGVPEQVLYVVRDVTRRNRLVGTYKMLFDLSPIGIALFDFESVSFLDLNPELERMLGYSREELLGSSYLSLVPLEDRDDVAQRISRDRLSPNEPYMQELVRRDGSRLPVSVTATVFFDVEGRKVAWGLLEDVRERLEAERKVGALLAEKDLVLKEVHHRIKNNFTVIKSILGMQSQAAPDERSAEAFRSTEGRVHSMALLYEKLYETAGFVEAPVHDYISSLTDEIVASFPNGSIVHVEADIDDFNLDARRLQPLGILINELVTNSMKYAFTGREAGRLSVSVKRAANQVLVSVADDGVGMPEGPVSGTSPGFGLTLVSVLASQLGGKLRFERNGGTRALFEFDIS